MSKVRPLSVLRCPPSQWSSGLGCPASFPGSLPLILIRSSPHLPKRTFLSSKLREPPVPPPRPARRLSPPGACLNPRRPLGCVLSAPPPAHPLVMSSLERNFDENGESFCTWLSTQHQNLVRTECLSDCAFVNTRLRQCVPGRVTSAWVTCHTHSSRI